MDPIICMRVFIPNMGFVAITLRPGPGRATAHLEVRSAPNAEGKEPADLEISGFERL
jgi:hypothetical protein